MVLVTDNAFSSAKWIVCQWASLCIVKTWTLNTYTSNYASFYFQLHLGLNPAG